jgi:hypothetical protein
MLPQEAPVRKRAGKTEEEDQPQSHRGHRGRAQKDKKGKKKTADLAPPLFFLLLLSAFGRRR